MLDNLKKYKVILASNSPRRKELLAGLGVDYEVRTLPDVDESYPETLQGADIPLYIAKEKADAYVAMMQSGELMITADTIVWLDGKTCGFQHIKEVSRNNVPVFRPRLAGSDRRMERRILRRNGL